MQSSVKDFLVDNVRDGQYCGIVVDIEDPLNLGRIRVEVFGFFDGLDIALIPWASPGNGFSGGSSSGSGSYSVPKLNSVVNVQFDNGNIYCPTYSFQQRISDELKEEVGDDRGAQSVIYDTDNAVKVYFTSEKGMMIDYGDAKVNIKPDKSILITNPNGDKVEVVNNGNINIQTSTKVTVKSPSVIIDAANTIELGKGATEDVVLGNRFMSLFNSHTHLGVLGIATSPPMTPMTPAQLSSGGGAPIVKTK
jgi:hypothetical protein